jgi:cell wall-associated NlpC family hydrolase
LRVRALGSALCSLAVLATVAPTEAPAQGTAKISGGTSVAPAPAPSAPSPEVAGGSTPAPAGAPVKPHVRTAPITARTASLAYDGPVYEMTPAGQVLPYTPPPPAGQTNGATGGSSVVGNAKPELLVPGVTARYVDGLAAAPMGAPPAVQQIIWTGNQIIGLPYIYGGGHASFASPGYDCSGTVSFALHGAALLPTPMDSSELMGWGGHGVGQWVTVFSDPEHAYMTVAGLRLDTSAADDPSNQQGPRWRPQNHG